MNEEYQHLFTEGPLSEAMAEYLSVNYEEAADYSEDAMISEYIYLKDNGQLNLIFEAVQLHNKTKTLAIS
ncbi:hypothetical protein H0I31_04130 [Tenacibaculum sp. AHE15PA]|uniref:hypothetical protein n=1 Tax=unclassified Tenacibaculum TaxID=2635139 RepID=UPI001C4F2C20|nr:MULTISPECIES: hypothetical protein [unclassified Tenacibaculum]QXP72894.1 hypothetical protein H0I30_09390 [Tenacibaculum sp. AHE14PA]QXP76808.1 hypothetical protein H0I31_04130 [Tenacibaculum sp. AHE15PA]